MQTDDSGVTDHDSGAATDAAADTATSAKPLTPQVTMVMKMAGALHASWKLNDTALTGVELWRAKDGAVSVKLVGLPGTAVAYHDTSASTATSSYCYKVKTLRAGAESEFSPEVCGMP